MAVREHRQGDAERCSSSVRGTERGWLVANVGADYCDGCEDEEEWLVGGRECDGHGHEFEDSTIDVLMRLIDLPRGALGVP